VGASEDPKVRDAVDVLNALARASRSYLLYDPRNDAVRDQLQRLRERFAHFLGAHGDLELEIDAEKLWMGDDTVYEERDREHSLAWKLYRDGVRNLTVRAGAEWSEIARLLEVLSLRYVGIHADEDDLVTLLWKAGLTSISIDAVEGFSFEEEATDQTMRRKARGKGEGRTIKRRGKDGQPEGKAGQGGTGQGTGTGDPSMPQGEAVALGTDAQNATGAAAEQGGGGGFDPPWPDLPQGPPLVTWPEITDEELAVLSAEVEGRTVTSLAVEAVRELLHVGVDADAPIQVNDVVPFLRDVKEVLLAEEGIEALFTFHDEMTRARANNPDETKALVPMLHECFDASALTKLVRAIPHDALEPPAQFDAMISRMSDPLPALLDLLEVERAESSRRVLRQLVERFLPARMHAVLHRLETARGGVAADLLRCLAHGAPADAAPHLMTMVDTVDTEVQHEFVRLIDGLDTTAIMRTIVVRLLHARESAVRCATLAAIARRGERGAFSMLAQHGERVSKEDPPEEEMIALGRAMAALDPTRATETFDVWAQPPGLLGRVRSSSSGTAKACAAAAGFFALGTPEAEGRLLALMSHPEAAVKQLITSMRRRAMAEARRAEAGVSSPPPSPSVPAPAETVTEARDA
jgi:hypothetical protein